MVFLRIVLIILVPVLAMLVLAYTQVYIQRYYLKGVGRRNREEQANWQHRKTLVDYLQSSSDGDLFCEMTDEEKEEGKDPDSS